MLSNFERVVLWVNLLIPALVLGVACSKRTNNPGHLELNSKLSEQVIYGADNRHDLYNEADRGVREVADSTVALIRRDALKALPNGSVTVTTKTFSESYSLCADEPFRDQDTAPFCSGFLVAPDTVISAGHCVTNDADCGLVSFVFGFALPTPSSSVRSVSSSEVYNCAKVLHAQAPGKGADFSVLKLDRPVLNHTPLKLRRSGSLNEGDAVLVIGHPSGLPLKIAGGAKVRKVTTDGYFQANLDTYGGNSGSAVFNSTTLEVEGVLVRGERDFVLDPDNKCMRSNRCNENECRGEDITLIEEVAKFL